jgi:hypothetical protein
MRVSSFQNLSSLCFLKSAETIVYGKKSDTSSKWWLPWEVCAPDMNPLIYPDESGGCNIKGLVLSSVISSSIIICYEEEIPLII